MSLCACLDCLEKKSKLQSTRALFIATKKLSCSFDVVSVYIHIPVEALSDSWSEQVHVNYKGGQSDAGITSRTNQYKDFLQNHFNIQVH